MEDNVVKISTEHQTRTVPELESEDSSKDSGSESSDSDKSSTGNASKRSSSKSSGSGSQSESSDNKDSSADESDPDAPDLSKAGASPGKPVDVEVTKDEIVMEFEDLIAVPKEVSAIKPATPNHASPLSIPLNTPGAHNTSSPEFVTPAKSLVLGAQVTPATASARSSGQPRGTSVAGVESTPVRPKSDSINEASKSGQELIEKTTSEPESSKQPIDSEKADRKARKKAKKAEKVREASEMEKEIKYLRKVAKLEAKLQRAERKKKKAKEAKATKNSSKGGKQPKEAKSSKSTKSKHDSDSTNDSSSEESASSNEPTTSSRIKKISSGRKLQRIAMSRTKELGLVHGNTIRKLEVTNALKKIGTTKFIVLPEHAYRMFHQVPGTGLPHIRRAFRSLCERYGALVWSIAKLHMELAQAQENAQNGLVRLEMVNDYTPIALFNNDLERAVATPGQPAASEESENTAEPPAKKIKNDDMETKDPAKLAASASRADRKKEKSERGDDDHKGSHKKKKKSKDSSKKSEVSPLNTIYY